VKEKVERKKEKESKRKEEIERDRRRKSSNYKEISRVESMTLIPNNQFFWFHVIGWWGCKYLFIFEHAYVRYVLMRS
jgi:hypothetical protein